MNLYELLFVSGTARSGTTLLSLVLSAHPEICICPETNHLITALHNADATGKIEKKRLDYLKTVTLNDNKLNNLKIDISEYLKLVNDYKSVTAEKFILDFLEFYRQQTKPDAKIIGQKKNYIIFYKKIKSFLPQSKLVCIFRDCRDSVPSAATKLPGQTLISASKQWAKRLKLSNEIKMIWPDNYKELFYEKFVSSFQKHCVEICQFLDVPYDDKMLNHYQYNTNLEQISKGQEMKHVRTKEPINSIKINKWKTSMTLKEKTIILSICRNQMIKNGYL